MDMGRVPHDDALVASLLAVLHVVRARHGVRGEAVENIRGAQQMLPELPLLDLFVCKLTWFVASSLPDLFGTSFKLQATG